MPAHGNANRPQTTLELYNYHYEQKMRQVAPKLRLELARPPPDDKRAFLKFNADYQEARAKRVQKDLERIERDLDNLLTRPVIARLSQKERAWIELPRESREHLHLKSCAPAPTLDLCYMELTPATRIAMADRGTFAPPAPSYFPGLLDVAQGVGEAVIGLGFGVMGLVASAGAALQPAPAATRYLEAPSHHDHCRTLMSSSSTTYERQTSRHRETRVQELSRAASGRQTAHRHDSKSSGLSRADSKASASTRHDFKSGGLTRADSKAPASTRHDGGSQSSRRTVAKTSTPSRAPSKAPAPSCHDAERHAPTRADSKMLTARRAEAKAPAPSRTHSKAQASSRHGAGAGAGDSEYTTLHIDMPSRSTRRK